ncbi:MAG: LacI family transcriptional regulator [Flavisolibacter sp.]|jgi:LacI family transcriptional regulator|nr:LacI family transcriptional regulator [Flavisolibacter sp.]
MRKQPSISDIAKKLNISVTTVSFILNGKAEEKRISKTLTNKVLKYVGEVGYVANHLAKSLRMGKTHILGLLVEDISNPFFARVAGAMEDIANKHGYRIFYCSSNNDTAKTKELIKVFEERQVDGYIITPAENIQDNIRSLLANKNKVILFDRFFPEIDTSYVVVDNEGGAYLATKHLMDQGYKNIAFVTTYSSQTQMAGRLKGYEKALKKNNLEQYIKRVDFNENNEAIIGEICSFFSSNTHLDAVFFATNYLGIKGLEAIKRLRIRIPTELAVVSFDDHDLFRLHSPSITAVAQPIQKMSESLITILLDKIEKGGLLQNQQVVVSPELIIRESSSAKA